MFESVYDIFKGKEIIAFILGIGVSIVLGLLAALVYIYSRKRRVATRDIPIMMIILPPVVAVLVGLTNLRSQQSTVAAAGGLILTGLFALTRFRSDPLSIMDLTFVVIASVIGMGSGLGYLSYTSISVLIVLLLLLVLMMFNFGAPAKRAMSLRIHVPEDLNYEEVFLPLLNRFCETVLLEKTRTTDGGQIFELKYRIFLKKQVNQKDLIDEIRVHNGNLDVFLTSAEER